MKLRILLVESDVEDVLFLQDVLTEIESGQFWSHWVEIETLHAPTAEEAATVLSNELIDLILLDLSLPDTQGTGTFRALAASAPKIPTILLVAPEDQALAVRLVRDGAQDFLLKKHIDCAPLAHAIQNAMERHRLLTAARASSTTDQLTGLPNRGGFLTLAERDCKLAERLHHRLMVMLAEPGNISEINSPQEQQRQDLTLVETTDRLRTLIGPTDILGRIGQTRFGLAIFETDFESVDEARARIQTELQVTQPERRVRIGAAIFDPGHPASLDVLLEQAALDLAPRTLVMRR